MNTKVTNGQAGGIVIDDTNAHAVKATALKALGGDVVFDTVVGNIENLDGQTLSNGDVVVGVFTSVKLASGACLVYA